MTAPQTVEEAVALLERGYGQRERLTLVPQKSPEGTILVRVGWYEHRLAAGWGSRGGYTREVEVVQWYLWVDGEGWGAFNTRRRALEFISTIREEARS